MGSCPRRGATRRCKLLAWLYCSLLYVLPAVLGKGLPPALRHRDRYSALTPFAQSELDFARGELDRQEFFEVSKPVEIPQGSTEVCSQVLVQHLFGNTINDPPTETQYEPLQNCGGDWTQITLRWHGTCKGRQFDRISAVWLGGVEVFRTCTAEPTRQGIVWTVEKDVTRYTSLFKEPQLVALELANVVDTTYTGIYNVTLSVHFYLGWKEDTLQESSADVILPFSEKSPLQGGYWFQIQNESDARSREIQIPRNTYKAVLEICVSFHGNDEFWYSNPPNEYLAANNLTGKAPGNGTFREVVVSVDGLLVAAVFPFPVFYTGGVDPFFWRPVSAIGSFVLPSYDVELTPLLGRLLDGKPHKFSVSVTNSINYWLVDANLHLWLDKSKTVTRGGVLDYLAPALSSSLKADIEGLDGTFLTEASRTISYKGYVESSLGNLTSSASYAFRFSNHLVFSNDGNSSYLHQATRTESKVVVKTPVKDVAYDHSRYHFPLRMLSYQIQNPDMSVYANSSIDHSWQQDQQSQGLGHNSFNSLKNKQRSKGELFISPKGVISGVATTKQDYAYESTEGCYFRTLGVKNYTFLYDHSDRRCSILS